MVWVAFDSIEFECCDGVVRSFRGCSIAGLLEFHSRLQELVRLIESIAGDQTLRQVYVANSQCRFLVDRCLELNGIKTDWVSFPMVEQLLFAYVDEQGNPQPGYLILLNRPDEVATKKADAEPLTEANAIAALSNVTSLAEALRIVATEPAKPVLRAVTEIAEMRMSSEEKEKRKFKNWAQEERQKLRAQVQG